MNPTQNWQQVVNRLQQQAYPQDPYPAPPYPHPAQAEPPPAQQPPAEVIPERPTVTPEEWAQIQQNRQLQENERQYKQWEVQYRQRNRKSPWQSKILYTAGATVVGTVAANLGLEGAISPEVKNWVVNGIVMGGAAAIAVFRTWFTSKFLH